MKILVTGHGGFAPGLEAATRMIAGEQPHVTWLAFQDGANLSDYQAAVQAVMAASAAEGLLVLTDLKGGTPFNVSMLLAQQYDQVAVVAGTNLAMILEATLSASFATSADALADQLVVTGRDGLVKGVLAAPVTATDDLDEEGI